eukprot:2088238-Amphidinium_carterae.1
MQYQLQSLIPSDSNAVFVASLQKPYSQVPSSAICLRTSDVIQFRICSSPRRLVQIQNKWLRRTSGVDQEFQHSYSNHKVIYRGTSPQAPFQDEAAANNIEADSNSNKKH